MRVDANGIRYGQPGFVDPDLPPDYDGDGSSSSGSFGDWVSAMPVGQVVAPIQRVAINLRDVVGRLPGSGVSQALVQRLWQGVDALEIHAEGFLNTALDIAQQAQRTVRVRDEQIANLQAWRPSKVLMVGAAFVGLASAKIIHSLSCWMFSSPKDDLSTKQIEVQPKGGITQAKVEQTAVAVIKAPQTQQEHLDARAEGHNRRNND